MDKKVTVIGAGNVGTTAAQRIVEKNLADVVLIDVVEGMPQGKALDIIESAPVEGFSASIIGTNNYEDTAGSDIIVITAGLARKPGMTREDLLNKNAEIIKGVVQNSIKYSKDAIIIVVTNPLDIMTQLAQKVSGFPSHRVIGMAGILDSARYRYFIAEALNTSPSQVQAMVLGGHGDSMVPMPRFSTVNGIPISELLPADKIEAINNRTRNGGAEIVALLKTGSAYYAPSASTVEMVQSILLNENKILPCSVLLNGQYQLNNVYCGVPVRLSAKGVESVIELDLTQDELSALKASAAIVAENVAQLKI